MNPVIEVTPALLRRRPLPLAAKGDKETRGRLLVVAGSEEVPGAALLTGEAALRAGAGKVTVVTPRSSCMALGLTLPEVRVLPLRRRATPVLMAALDALVVGPGMARSQADLWVLAALAHDERFPVLLDAAALAKLWDKSVTAGYRRNKAGKPLILTPHAGELAECMGRSKDQVLADPLAAAGEAAAHLGALVILKGATTVIATGEGTIYRHRAKVPGLAMSGSGDVLAGIIGGLLARGTAPLDAALWGVVLHVQAGRRLAAAEGRIGFRARDIAAEIPALMDRHSRS